MPILTALDDLTLRLKTITASTPEVIAYGRHMATDVLHYRDTVNQLALQRVAVEDSLQALNAVRQAISRILHQQEQQTAAQSQRVSREIGAIVQRVQDMMLGFSISVLAIATLFTTWINRRHINQPLQAIIGGIDNIRDGLPPVWSVLGRTEEWHKIQVAIEELWSELARSNQQLQEINASLEQRVQERTAELETAKK